eukprot:GILJ01001280.1.p1 GENE.GILJ01001280.1~~GILJ01001280.1.p1  ORF type:complete len:430 (+),score=44.38 GILJ01001280.1:57-1346(+)
MESPLAALRLTRARNRLNFRLLFANPFKRTRDDPFKCNRGPAANKRRNAVSYVDTQADAADVGGTRQRWSSEDSDTTAIPSKQEQQAEAAQEKRALELLTSRLPPAISTLDFDCLSMADQDLRARVTDMFAALNLFQIFHIEKEIFSAFLLELSSRYILQDKFHTFKHAVDVCQFCFVILTRYKAKLLLRDIDVLILLISCLAHDIGHPGVSNAFLIMTQDPLALRYNDKSVLENHHAFEALQMLKDSWFNVLKHLDPDQMREARTGIISTILATDLAKQKGILRKVSSRLVAGPWSRDSNEDRLLLMRLIIKASDVSNATRPWEISKMWSDLIVTEFLDQRAKEIALGICSSVPIGERSDQCRMASGFCDFVVRPIFECLCGILPGCKESLDSMEHNYILWGVDEPFSPASPVSPAARGFSRSWSLQE